MSEWKPIEELKIPPFDAAQWVGDVLRVLVVADGNVIIATYGYTERGEGFWKDQDGRNCSPTHWMPLPKSLDAFHV